MNPQDYPDDTQQPDANNFVYLLFGLHSYLQDKTVIPNTLRRALSALASEQIAQFPKTLYAFIELCHRPVSDWYPPSSAPDDFNSSQPLLYDRQLSEEARDFYLTVIERLGLPAFAHADIPQAALDNLKMVELLQRLREDKDPTAAQELYVQIRSFLIEHSWTTADQLRAQPLVLIQALREFYEEMPPLPTDEIVICDRCGLLEWRDGHWQGIKPSFCSDHGSGSPYLRTIRRTGRLYRLREGIHLQTFLPGRLERVLFALAENAQAAYPALLLSVERYPGLDTFDLRLVFADEAWAIDAKDHAKPIWLASHIRPFYNEGDLSHTHAFYVLPDERMEEPNYREQLEQRTAALVSHQLHIVSVAEFQQHVEDKLKSLAHLSRSKRGKKA